MLTSVIGGSGASHEAPGIFLVRQGGGARVRPVMKAFAINLLMIVALSSCDRTAAEKRKAADRDAPAAQADPHGNKVDDKRRYVMSATGIRSPKYLIPYMIAMSLDMGSHTWIYKIADDGEMVPYLLFLDINANTGKRSSYEAFLLTQSDGGEKRTRLSPAEVERRFRDIESDLAKCGAKDRYDYYYGGGVPDEPEASETSVDPFAAKATPPRDLDSDEALRKMSEEMNQRILWDTAEMIRCYREVTKSQGAQPGDGK